MKVCIFGDTTSVHLQRIVPGLAARGLSVHVVTHKSARLVGATVERFHVPPPSLARPFRWETRRQRYLREFFSRFDVVHVHFLADWGLSPQLLQTGCFLATPWGSDLVTPPGEGNPSPTVQQAQRMMLRHATLVTAWGATFARTVAQFAGIAHESIALLPLGVDLELFRADAQAVRLRTGKRVGFFKGFRPVYGGRRLIEAMPFILRELPDVCFELIGDGADLPACRKLAAELNVAASVDWLPTQPHHRLPGFLAHWDVAVVPSVCESFGVAALEASAMEVPVVGSRTGGLVETVRDGETGLLVTPDSPEELAGAIVRLLRDDGLRRRMGAAGRSMVARDYEWNGILDEWVRTYARARDRFAAAA